MAENRDRGVFHHHHDKVKKPEDAEVVVVESTEVYGSSTAVDDGKPYDAKEEHLAEAGALLGGAVAMFETHQAKKDPKHAHKHRIGEAIAAAVAVGSGARASPQEGGREGG